MKKLKTMLIDKKLYLFFIITLVFFGIFAKMDFATDTYAVIGNSKESIMENFLQSGRIITALFWQIISTTNTPIDVVYLCSFVLAIIVITLAIYKLFRITNEIIKNDFISGLISVLIIINPFSIELFMYIEKGIIALSVLASIWALELFVDYLKNEENKKKLLYAILCMLLAIFSYQGVPALFIALSTVFVFKYSDSIIKTVKNFIISLFIYGIPAVANFIIVRFVFTGHRVNGSIEVGETIKKLIAGCKNMMATYLILPKYFYMICLILAVIVAIVVMIRKKKFLDIVEMCFVCIITVFVTIMPQALQNTESIWFVSRSTYTFASLLGIVELFCLIEIQDNDKKDIVDILLTRFLVALSVVFLIVEFYRFYMIEIDHYNSNYNDQVISLQIGNMIKKYQEETGNTITKISIYKDSSPRFININTFATGDINVSAFATEWSDANAINYYNGLKLEKVPNDDDKKEMFKKEDWQFFDEEQVIFENDTIHVCVY